ncbi:MAG: hypothetical protein K9L28_11490 [Synergistales bacterium]|nr:hypothetical protein [Synergistales bacterium]
MRLISTLMDRLRSLRRRLGALSGRMRSLLRRRKTGEEEPAEEEAAETGEATSETAEESPEEAEDAPPDEEEPPAEHEGSPPEEESPPEEGGRGVRRRLVPLFRRTLGFLRPVAGSILPLLRGHPRILAGVLAVVVLAGAALLVLPMLFPGGEEGIDLAEAGRVELFLFSPFGFPLAGEHWNQVATLPGMEGHAFATPGSAPPGRHTLEGDGLRISLVVSGDLLQPEAITVTDPSVPVRWGLRVGSYREDVLYSLGSPDRRSEERLVYTTPAGDEAVFTVDGGRVARIAWRYSTPIRVVP